jgi:hypothetical protein
MAQVPELQPGQTDARAGAQKSARFCNTPLRFRIEFVAFLSYGRATADL